MNGEEENGGADPDTATLSKKFSFFEKGGGENGKKESEPVTSERLHAAKECKASSVINKFKDLEKRAANGEDDYGEDSVAADNRHFPSSKTFLISNLNFFAVTFDPDKPPITPLGFLGTFSGGESWLGVNVRACKLCTNFGVFIKRSRNLVLPRNRNRTLYK